MELSNSKIPDFNTISIPSSKHQCLKNINHIYISNKTFSRKMRPPTDAFVALHRLITFGGRGHYLLMSLFFTFLFFIYRSHVSVYLSICFLRLHTTFTCYLHQFIPVTRYIPVICYLCQHHRTVI